MSTRERLNDVLSSGQELYTFQAFPRLGEGDTHVRLYLEKEVLFSELLKDVPLNKSTETYEDGVL